MPNLAIISKLNQFGNSRRRLCCQGPDLRTPNREADEELNINNVGDLDITFNVEFDVLSAQDVLNFLKQWHFRAYFVIIASKTVSPLCRMTSGFSNWLPHYCRTSKTFSNFQLPAAQTG